MKKYLPKVKITFALKSFIPKADTTGLTATMNVEAIIFTVRLR